MRTPQFLLPRGGTPVLELCLPFVPEAEDTVYLTLCQGGVPVLEYAMNGQANPPAEGSLSLSEDGTLLARMTQSDTLRLAAGECELQVRVKTDLGADVFPILRGAVSRLRKQGVI
jgi:hypothetical protein